MAQFDITGNYELRYREQSGQSFRSMVKAFDDEDALRLARATRYAGLTLEVWQKDRLVTRLSPPLSSSERQAH